MASNKSVYVLGGLLATVALAYTGWRFTPFGKEWLNKWLMKKWKALAEERKHEKVKSWERVQQDLNSLDYKGHELLFFLTRLDPMGKNTLTPSREKRYKSLLEGLNKRGVFQKTGLNQLEGLIFPT